MPPISLREVLSALPDPRSRHGRRHPLVPLLCLVSLGLLLGRRSLDSIAKIPRDFGADLLLALGFPRRRGPSADTLSDVLSRLDPGALEAALARWASGRPAPAGAQVCLDGKALCGSRDGELPGQHLLAAYCPEARAVLAQVRVGATTNEHKAALELLGVLPLAGRVVTGDAMFTHKDVAQKVRDGGGDYVLMVKDNQPELKADILAALHPGEGLSPPAAAAGRGGAAVGAGGRQGARPQRGAGAGQHDDAVGLPGLAGRLPGVRAEAAAHPQGGDDAGAGVGDQQPGPRRGRRGAAARAGARALGDRERPALGARREHGRGPLPGAQGQRPAGAGGAA
jgi:DDE_Tnp_1-associated/Transposase DDE domain